jgi:hypothetical protein
MKSKYLIPLRLLCAALSVVPLLASCTSPDTFRNVAKDQPHAVLTARNPFGMRGFFGLGREVSPHAINAQRVSFWNVGLLFRIPPGPSVVHPIDASEPYSYGPIHFVAVAGRQYVLRPTRLDERDAVTLSELAPGVPEERVIATSLRGAKWRDLYKTSSSPSP